MATLRRLRPAGRPAFAMAALSVAVAAAIATIALGATALLSSCSYLLGDPYGTIGQRTVAWTDLNGAIKTATGSGLDYVNRMSFLSSGGHSYLFLYLNTADQTQIFVALDGTSLALDKAMSSTVYYQTGTNIAVDMNGNFVTSYPAGLALSPTLAVVASPTPPLGLYCLAADATNNISMAATSGSTALALSSYAIGWGTATATSSPPLSTTASGWQLTDAATSGGNLLLLFTNPGGAIEVSYPGTSIYSTLSTQPYIIDGAPSKSAVAYNSNQMAWATSEGLVVGVYVNNGIELDLYKLGDSGKTSSYSITTNGSAAVYVEPDGRYFFYYDPGSGRLYKMRTWW